MCELYKVSKKHIEIFSHLRCSSKKKIERKTMKVCESEKEKLRHFSFLKLQTRKINWCSSFGVLSATTMKIWSV